MTQFSNYNAIMGPDKFYKVPIYQRDYSWTREDWEDLWNDIMDIPEEKNHYMGYLVLQPFSNGNPSFIIIDGQQRITTLSVLSLAVVALLRDWKNKNIDARENEVRAEKLTEKYLGNFSTSNLTLSSKLRLNRNNNDYYQSYLLHFRKPPSISRLKQSEKLLQKAFDFFYAKLSEYFVANKSGAEVAKFLERTVGNGLIFTVIEVQNDLDAFKVFETLNARGVKLSAADLLKNYLFSEASKLGQLELDEAERRWQNTSDILKSNDLTTFIRHYWSGNYQLESKAGLFKSIKRNVTTAEGAFALLQSLEDSAAYYAGFNDPSDEMWDRDEKKYLTVIKLLEVTTCYSLMISAAIHLPRPDYKTLLRELASISFRYTISGQNPKDAEVAFSKAAVAVAKERVSSIREIVGLLRPIYITDENFEQWFAASTISTKRNKNLVKYILVEFENHLSGSDLHYEDSTSSIEHILPEAPSALWEEQFDADEYFDYVYRFGNYTLLETSINNKLGNDVPFDKKHEAYVRSRFKMTREHLNYEFWNPATLQLHQQQMAKWAKAIWKTPYL